MNGIIKQKMKKTAIIILHFGDKKDTIECLWSLRKIKEISNIIIFVVDNGTNTLTNKDLQPILPQVRLIKIEKNLGFAGGNNVGIKKALKENVDFILLLNNDAVIVSPFLIEKLTTPFKNSSVGITGSLITYYNEPKKIWFAGGYLNKTFCFTRHPFMNKYINNTLPEEKIVDFITGAAMMIKKEVFEKVGLFDEKYFLYWEDVDFCIRVRNSGYKCYFVNKSLIKHKVSASGGIKGTNKLSPTRAYYYARNPFVFMKKNNHSRITEIIGQIFIRLPFYITTVDNFKAAKEYIRGLIDGIKLLL